MGTIAVLGTGPSLGLFNPSDFPASIGVNDIWAFHHTEAIVCLNPRKDFTPERLKIIDESKPKFFYSQIVNWDSRDDFFKIDIAHGYPDGICNLSVHQFQKSYCSPFVACQIAYRYWGATEIHLFGVDMVNHPNLNGFKDKMKLHFRNLSVALKEKGCKIIVYGDGILKNIL